MNARELMIPDAKQPNSGLPMSESSQTVGVMFGRFNPPHKGHKNAWEMASENDQWYIGTNQNTQNKKNPLPYDVKIKAMEALWEPVAAHIVPEIDVFTLVSRIYVEHGETNLVVYTDEAWLMEALEKYNGEQDKHGYYKFATITNQKTPRLSSATDVRAAVQAGDRQAFEQAAGVPADTMVDGKPYFDLVAEYLNPYFAESVKTDKYNYNTTGTTEEYTMNTKQLNEMRQLAGLPLQEAAPVDYYGMSEAEKKLADIGRLLMQRAETNSNDELSNHMSMLGSALSTGDIKDQQGLVSMIKDAGGLAKELANEVTGAMGDYAQGDRAEIDNEVGQGRSRKSAEPEDDFGDDTYASDADDDQDVPELEPEDEFESVDLSSMYETALDEEEEVDEDEEVEEAAKPDFADIDGDGDEEESAKKAAKDKKEKTDEAIGEGKSTINQMVAKFEQSMNDHGFYGMPDPAAVQAALDSGDTEEAAVQLASSFTDKNGGEPRSIEIYDYADEAIEDYMYTQNIGESTYKNDLAKMRKLAGL